MTSEAAIPLRTMSKRVVRGGSVKKSWAREEYSNLGLQSFTNVVGFILVYHVKQARHIYT